MPPSEKSENVPFERKAHSLVSQSDKLLEFSDVSFQYTSDSVEILKNLSFSLDPGTMVLIMGPTGCGKTTMVLAMNGLVPASTGGNLTGEVVVEGKSTKTHTTAQLADTIGLVFQDPEGQMCTLFLEDEIAFGLENLQVEPAEIAVRVEEMLDFIGLKGLNHKSVFGLSGGQKQKVNFASVLATQPRIIVADMPTANLDPVGSEEVLVVLRNLVLERKTTCVVVENHIDELAYLADRIIVLNDGKIQYDGSPTEIFGSYGQILRDQIGVNIPQVVEIALSLRDDGCDIGIPLSNEAIIDALKRVYNEGCIKLVDHLIEDIQSPHIQDEIILDIHDVGFTYPDGTNALQGVSFQMKRGEILAIIGNNGSGKTTLAKLIVGVLRPTDGDINVLGLATSKVKVRDIAKKVSYIFQYPDQQFVTQMVFDEVAYNLRNLGLPDEEVNERVDAILTKFKLTEFSDKSPFMLSGGEMRTLSVACMLTFDPEIVILDEPTYGQDLAHVRALMQRLEEQRDKGTSIILITHDMQLVAEYADHVAVMNNGSLIFDGVPSDLYNQKPLLKQASLKEPPVSKIVSELIGSGIPISDKIITTEQFLKAFQVLQRP